MHGHNMVAPFVGRLDCDQMIGCLESEKGKASWKGVFIATTANVVIGRL
jgi:hypothetical protein